MIYVELKSSTSDLTKFDSSSVYFTESIRYLMFILFIFYRLFDCQARKTLIPLTDQVKQENKTKLKVIKRRGRNNNTKKRIYTQIEQE